MTGVACDLCTLPIDAIADASAFTWFDGFGRCTRQGLAHAHCVGELRQKLGDSEDSIADQPAKEFLEASAVRGPRSHSGRLVLARVRQLWRHDPDVRRRPPSEKSA